MLLKVLNERKCTLCNIKYEMKITERRMHEQKLLKKMWMKNRFCSKQHDVLIGSSNISDELIATLL